MKKMTEGELVSLLREDLFDSYNYEVQASRANALDYYNLTGTAIEANPGDICDGRSRLVSSDVSDMVDACVSMIMPSLTDGVCEFEPTSQEDESQCQTETDIVNYMMWDKNRGYAKFRDGLFDSLLEKNACVKTYWEENEYTDVQEYKGLSTEELQYLAMEAMQDESKEITEFDESGKEGYSLEITTTTTDSYPCFESFPPEQIRVNSDHANCSVCDARFVSHSPTNVTESDLIEQGYDKAVVQDLKGFDYNDDMGATSRSRTVDRDSQEQSGPNRQLDYHEIYTLVDWNGDGVSERRRIVLVGSKILENEECPYVPIITGSCIPVPHQFWGLSIYDKLKGIQDAKTQFLRASIDNLNLGINNRMLVNPDQIHNPDELMTSRPGGIIQVKRPDAVTPLPTAPMDGGVLTMMQYMDKMRTEKAGAALDMTAENIPVGGNSTAHAAERIMSSMEMIQAQMTTAYTEYMVREVFLHTHKLLRRNAKGPITARVGSDFVESDPRTWPVRDNVNIVVGASAGERSRKARAMQGVLQQQMMMLQLGGGGTMLNPQGMYNANTDLARFSGLDFPDQYYLDPSSDEAKQATMKQAQMQQQQAQKAEQDKQQMLQFQAQMTQMGEDTKRQKTQSDAHIKMQELQLEYMKVQAEAMDVENDNMREEQKLELEARIKMASEETKRIAMENQDEQFWEELAFKYDEMIRDTQTQLRTADQNERTVM